MSPMRIRRRRPPLRVRAAATVAVGLLLGSTGLAGCGGGDDSAQDPAGTASESAASSSTTSSATSSATGTATAGSSSTDAGRDYPEFAPQDYVYRLEVLCYCPQVGAVRVKVAGGKVASATTLGGGRGARKGAPAPDFARLTINQVIAMANSPKPDKVEVTWPDGQDYPSVVEVDHVANATDDEVTYTIKRVRVLD